MKNTTILLLSLIAAILCSCNQTEKTTYASYYDSNSIKNSEFVILSNLDSPIQISIIRDDIVIDSLITVNSFLKISIFNKLLQAYEKPTIQTVELESMQFKININKTGQLNPDLIFLNKDSVLTKIELFKNDIILTYSKDFVNEGIWR